MKKELLTFTQAQQKLYEKDRFQFFFKNTKLKWIPLFLLGYYTHLIADDNWLSGFSTLAKNRIENDETIAPMYYNDFKLLNAKLLHHYDQEQQLFSLLNQEAHIVDIEEVSKKRFSFSKVSFEDMLYPEQHLYEELQVFTFNQIVGYIETAIEKAHFY